MLVDNLRFVQMLRNNLVASLLEIGDTTTLFYDVNAKLVFPKDTKNISTTCTLPVIHPLFCPRMLGNPSLFKQVRKNSTT